MRVLGVGWGEGQCSQVNLGNLRAMRWSPTTVSESAESHTAELSLNYTVRAWFPELIPQEGVPGILRAGWRSIL